MPPSDNPLSIRTQTGVLAFWRDVRVWRVFGQVVFLALVVVIAAALLNNMLRALAARNIGLGFDFLRLEAGFAIQEGIPYRPSDTYAHAFVVGLVNTLRVAFLGILLATPLGLLMGIARLSSNWLVSQIAGGYVEVIRNTPLLVQLSFWYFGIIFNLPPVQDAIALPGPAYLSNRGLALPSLRPTADFGFWLAWMAAGLAVGIVAAVVLSRRPAPRSWPMQPALWLVGMAVLGAALGWFLAPERPLRASLPVLSGLNFSGGTRLSPEFVALLVGLVVYTGAFIAEVVRAGIQAVPKGQVEAARAMGLSGAQTLRFIVLPQALRVIVPPLTSQYLNLTKNSSLAVYVGYPDLYMVSNLIYSQTDRAVQIVLMVMGTYLVISLLTSLLMNYYNRRVRLVER